jgi:NADH-quinone oxidoreductase subunit N
MGDFAGLARRAPVLSLCLLVFLLSLAGIPPLAGFFGKFYVFAAAANAGDEQGLLWLVILGIATSVVSLYYYLMVLKQVYVERAPDDAGPLRGSIAAVLCAVVLCLLVLWLGCFPSTLVNLIQQASLPLH